MSPRQKLIEKIKALLSKTMENGCTEAEALAAMTKARDMMAAYEVTEQDIAFGGEEVTQKVVVRTDHDDIRSHLATAVGRFCHCSSWKSRGTFDSITFCGLQSETVLAHWMLDMLADFVIRERDGYMGGRRMRKSFIAGCVARIAERLEELTPRGTGTDLMVCRQSLIDAYMTAHGIKLREPFKIYKMDDWAYADGAAAGDRARFNKPMEGDATRGLLK